MANRVEIPIIVLSDASPTSPVSGATAVVKDRSTNKEATVFSDSGATNNVVSQPLTTGSTGSLTGWLSRGAYEIVITIPGKTPYAEYLDVAPGSDGAVDTAWIANSAVTETKIANDAVTAPKIAENAVGSSEIASGAVGSSELAPGAVETSKVANQAIGRPQLASPAIQSMSVETGEVLNGENKSVTLTWPTAFADNAYDVAFSIRRISTVFSTQDVRCQITQKFPSSITVTVENKSGLALKLEISAIATHR